jgi:hypothetical protein
MIDAVQLKGSASQRLPAPGRYRHFKGNEYELLMVARHSETEELLAVYLAVDEPGRIWARPVEMFAERVLDGEELKLRFEPAPAPPEPGGRGFKLVRPLLGFIKRSGRTSLV